MMKKIPYSVAAATIFFAMAGAALGFLEPPALSPLPVAGISRNFTTLDEAIKDGEQFIEKLFYQLGLPSLVYGFAHRNRTLYENHWGWADVENRIPASRHGHYRLCSISKTFTAAMIGRLVDQGLLRYDTPVNDILKYLPPMKFGGGVQTLTVGQLLSHMAGTHVTAMNDFETLRQYQNASTVVSKFMHQPLLHKPGSAFNYSNVGFEMLASVVEALTNQTYPEAVSKMLKSVGLLGTYPATSGLMINHRPRYYRRVNVQNLVDHRLIPTALFDELLLSEGYFGSGGLLSTVQDLLHWGQLLLDAYHGRDNRLLSRETVRNLWHPHTPDLANVFPSGGNHQYYGYGWFISNLTAEANAVLRYKNYVWHSGGLLGTTTILMIEPNAELIGVAMTNEGYTMFLDSMVVYMAENVGQFITAP